jgi:hypothetical protein
MKLFLFTAVCLFSIKILQSSQSYQWYADYKTAGEDVQKIFINNKQKMANTSFE